jgi:hypothetical protein
MLHKGWRDEQSEALGDSIDEFCYQLAFALRRVLSLDENPVQHDEDLDD